jgi:hypothetical protein
MGNKVLKKGKSIPFCETWMLKENIKSKLRVFERKVIRRIYGPTKESDGIYLLNNGNSCERCNFRY